MVNCSEQNKEHNIPLTIANNTNNTGHNTKLQRDALSDAIRVRNALNHVSNGTSSQLPTPSLPPDISNTSASAVTSTLSPKRIRKKKEVGTLVPVSASVPGTVTVIVKNRFKHSRPAYVGATNTPNKRQKTGLDLLSESYQEEGSKNSPSSSSSSSFQGQPGPATIVQTTSGTAAVGDDLRVSQPIVQSTTAAAEATSTPLHPTLLRQTPLSICSGCKSTDTYHMGNGVYKCHKCNRNYMPLNRCFHSTTGATVTTAILPAATFYGSPAAGGGVAGRRVTTTKASAVDAQTEEERRTSSARKSKQLETIDLISSDEDEDQLDTGSSNHPNQTATTNTSSANSQTPQPNTPANNSRIAGRMRLPCGEAAATASRDNNTSTHPTTSAPSSSTGAPKTSPEYVLHCNQVMFGELYGKSIAPLRIVDNRMYLSLECLIVRKNQQATEKYTLSVGSNDVEEIFAYIGRIPSFIAILTAEKFASVACKRIDRNVLVPKCEEDIKKRYIILALKSAFKNDIEADAERRNFSTAVSPWAKLTFLPHHEATLLIGKLNLDVCQKEIYFGKVPVETLLNYPPSLKSGGIPITTLDVACLDEEIYLNDVIIDFYMKYLCESVMTKEQRDKTYIFSSYFYKRLTQKSGQKVSPAVMHAQVKKWTRNVDIFQKDFILIPVNEHCHWYLVIVCFASHNVNVDEESNNEKEEEEEEEDAPDFTVKEVEAPSPDAASDITEAPELSSTPPPPPPPLTEDSTPIKSFQDAHKEKAEEPSSTVLKAKSQIEENSDNGDTTTPGTSAQNPVTANNTEDAPAAPPAPPAPVFKQATDSDAFTRPCILIFDSLVVSGHSKVFTNLRHYLTQEWASRKPKEPPRVFDKETMKGCYPKVPHQNNDCDCGVFILQYAESFFTKPVKNFRIPMHLETWFTVESVTKKREEIKDLIHTLAGTHKKYSSTATSSSNVNVSKSKKL